MFHVEQFAKNGRLKAEPLPMPLVTLSARVKTHTVTYKLLYRYLPNPSVFIIW